MSRQQATKSRDKGGSRGGGGAQSVPVPVVSNDVVPGRVTVADWNKMLANDDDDDLVGSIVDDMLEDVMEQCYQKYIWQQVVPYTVYQAKDDLLDIITWRFLSHDTGEEDMQKNLGWAEDFEPEPGVIDSWAQGSVPIIVTKSPEEDEPMPPIEEDLNKSEDVEETIPDESETISLNPDLAVQTPEKEPKEEQQKKEKEKEVEKPKPTKRKIKYKRHVGRLPSAHLGEMTKTLEHSESEILEREFSSLNRMDDAATHLSPSQKSLIKLQAGRPPGNKEVTFDEHGNVLAVMRLDPKSLPSHRVKVHYCIVDPEAEAAAQRLEAMRTGKLRTLAKIHWKPKPVKMRISPRKPMSLKPVEETRPLFPMPPSPRRHGHGGKPSTMHTQRSTIYSRLRGLSRKRDDGGSTIEPLPPSLIDSINVSPGVTMKEGDKVKIGSFRPLTPLQSPPVVSEDGAVMENETMTPTERRPMRALGTSGSHGKYDASLISRPMLSPSQVIGGAPTVSSPFSMPQAVPPFSSSPVVSPT